MTPLQQGAIDLQALKAKLPSYSIADINYVHEVAHALNSWQGDFTELVDDLLRKVILLAIAERMTL